MRSTWKIVGGVIAVMALTLSSAVPALASTGGGKNVGYSNAVSGSIYDGPVNSMLYADMVGYTCSSVHETLNVMGIVASTGRPGRGLQDFQSCQLASGSPLPTKPTTYTPGDYYNPSYFTDTLWPSFWVSDYQATVNNMYVWADNWTYTITPTGALKIISFHANVNDTCQTDPTFTTVGYCYLWEQLL
jgi:hypothetical protein